MSENLLLPQTKALMASLPPEPKLVLRAIVRKVLDRVWRGGAVISNEGLSRIDYFSPVLDTEFEMLKERNPWFSAQYVIWNYGTVEDDFVRGSVCVNSLGSDLLVGNSSSASNNHLELFDWLRGRSDLGGRKVFAPLSYGSESYKNAIVAAGLERLNDRFVPLTDFQPVDQYLKTVSRCGFVFMNHLRQQAVGNVVIALVSGAKLFLNPRNPLYGWLQARGAVVFDIGSLDNSHPDSAQVFNPVCEHDILRNREVAISHWGREAQREKTRMIVDLLKQ